MQIAIAGAGIFGLTAALELRRRGHGVTVLDAGPVPHPLAESTDVSKVVRMDYADPHYLELMDETFAGWRRWNQSWGMPLYHEVGFLILTRSEMAVGGVERTCLEALQRRAVPAERLGAAEIEARFPAWKAGAFRDGYFNPRAGWVESGRVVERLASEARAAGVSVREGEAVMRLDESDGRVAGVVTGSGARLRADLVIVAAGSWTPILLPHLRELLWSTAQTVLHFRAPEPERFRPPRFSVWAVELGREGWYGFPALADGRVKIANHGLGRRLEPDDSRAVPPGDEPRFRDFLRGALPELAGAPLAESRVCLYSDTWDGDFYIDHDPDRPGLFVAAGGSGHGFKFAPSLGPIIADRVEGRLNRWGERFRWRRRGAVAPGRK